MRGSSDLLLIAFSSLGEGEKPSNEQLLMRLAEVERDYQKLVKEKSVECNIFI